MRDFTSIVWLIVGQRVGMNLVVRESCEYFHRVPDSRKSRTGVFLPSCWSWNRSKWVRTRNVLQSLARTPITRILFMDRMFLHQQQ